MSKGHHESQWIPRNWASFIFHSSEQPKQSFLCRETVRNATASKTKNVGLVLFFFFWVTDLYQQFLRFCHQADLAVYPTSHKWISPTYPTYKQGYNLATKWGEPPSILTYLNLCLGRTGICLECIFLATIIWPELKFSEHFSQLTWHCFNVVLVLLVDL